ncbi:MAG: Ig-like domain-containing protein [Acidobacteriota bacterium]
MRFSLSVLTTALALTLVSARPVEAQFTFEPGFEGELWQTLPPIGQPLGSDCVDWYYYDPDLDQTVFIPDIRAYTGTLTPFPDELSYPVNALTCGLTQLAARTSELLYPTDLAVTPTGAVDATTGLPLFRAYVLDQSFGRVVTFLARPNGVWEPVDLPGADWHADTTTLSLPEGIVVDEAPIFANRRIIISDFNNGKLKVYTVDGALVDTIDLPDTITSSRPGGVAISPGTIYGVSGTIAVTDADNNVVHIVDAATRAVIGSVTTADDPVKGPFVPTGVVFDAAGRLLVADNGRSQIIVFEYNASTVAWDEVTRWGSATFQFPYSLSFDSRGRLLVSDTDNQRLMVFQPDYDTNPLVPQYDYLFELNAEGKLDGYPRGVVEDPYGRLLVVDLSNHEVKVFQVPDLAVYNVEILNAALEPASSIQPGDTIHVAFSVTVPAQKFNVISVVPTCQPVNGSPVSGSNVPAALAGSPAFPIPVLAPGEAARYACSYTVNGDGALEFELGATGNPDAQQQPQTAAPAVTVSRTVACEGCETDPPTVSAAVSGTPGANGWYTSGTVTITVEATDPPSVPGPEAGIRFVYYQFIEGAQSGPVMVVESATPVASLAVPVVVTVPGKTVLRYWAEDFFGNLSHPTPAAAPTTTVFVDPSPPSVTFAFDRTPNQNGWYRAPVSASYTTADLHSGVDTTTGPASPVTFATDGAGQFFTVTATDFAGNVNNARSDNPALGGRPVNLDQVPPTVTATVTPNEPSGIYQGSAIVTLSATDGLSGVEKIRYGLSGAVLQGDTDYSGPITIDTPGVTFVRFWAIDRAGNLSSQQTLPLDINGPPNANPDSAATNEDVAVDIDVLANDTDPNNDVLSASAPPPSQGTVQVVVIGGRTWIRFTPARDFNGVTTFTYTASDGRGGTATALVTVNVTPVNDPPVIGGDPKTFTTPEDQALSLAPAALLAGVVDVDNDPLSISAVGSATNGTVAIVAGQIVFTPTPNYHGPASFEYTVGDGNGGSATSTAQITVTPVNDNPVAGNDTAATDEDTVLTIAPLVLLANDTDVDGDTLTVSAVGGAVNGSVAIVGGNVEFTPAPNFHGAASFQYTVNDGNGGTATATVSVTVRPVNDAPVANPDTATTPEDQALTIAPATLLANDTDVDGDTLTLTAVGNASNGTVQIVAGQVVFTPAPNFFGTASFEYTVSDGNGGFATGTVTVTVTNANDAPVANDDTVTTPEDVPLTLSPADLLLNDGDLDGDGLTIVAVGSAVNGTVEIVAGQVVFTPAANFSGTASFEYTVSDGNGGTDTATVTVVVTPVNDAPIANDDAVTTDEETPIAIDFATLLANDTDVENDTLTILSAGNAVNGTVVLAGGQVVFTPAPNFSGTASFDYTVSDGNGGTDTATVTVNVVNANDDPVAVDDTAATDEDTPLTIAAATLLANDTDADDDTLTITAVDTPVNGTVQLVGSQVIFTPAPNFFGTASFDYTVSDGHGGTATATVTVNVRAVNDVPVAVDDTVGTTEDTPLTIAPATLLANDTDADGDALTITAVGNAVNGTVNLVGGQIVFTPALNFFGTASFRYTVSDGNGGTAAATVTVSVAPVNDLPIALPDVASGRTGDPVIIVVLANDSDVEGPLTVISATNGANGTTTVNADGTITYVATGGFVGVDTFTYTVQDSDGAVATATVRVTSVVRNRPPVCTNATGGEIWPPNHKRHYAAPIRNVTDPDGDALTIVVTGIFQDEPVDTTGDGQFSPDGYGVGTSTAWVRAERMGSGNGRVYEIQFRATDAAGDSCTGKVYYTVPKSKGQPWQVIDSGVRYDSTVHVPGTRDKDQTHTNRPGDRDDDDDECRNTSHDHRADRDYLHRTAKYQGTSKNPNGR